MEFLSWLKLSINLVVAGESLIFLLGFILLVRLGVKLMVYWSQVVIVAIVRANDVSPV